MPDAPRLRVARRPLDTLGITFQMLRAGLRPLLWAIVKYAGPAALVGGAGIGAFYGGLFQIFGQQDGDLPGLGLTEGVGMLVGGIGLYAAYAVVVLLVAAWVRRHADGEPLGTDLLWGEARPHLGAMARLALLLVGAMLAAGVVLGLLFALVTVLPKGLAVVLALLLFPALFVAAFFAAPATMMVGQPMVSENLGAWAALRRSWALLAGVRGGAGVLTIVIYMIVTMIGYVAYLPLYAVLLMATLWGGVGDMGESMEKMGYAVGFVLVPVTLLPQVLYFIAGGVLYYARVEATEHVGLGREVNALLGVFPEVPGSAATPPPLDPRAGEPEPPAFPDPRAGEPETASGDRPAFSGASASPDPRMGSEARPGSVPPPLAPPDAAADDALDRWRGPRPADPADAA